MEGEGREQHAGEEPSVDEHPSDAPTTDRTKRVGCRNGQERQRRDLLLGAAELARRNRCHETEGAEQDERELKPELEQRKEQPWGEEEHELHEVLPCGEVPEHLERVGQHAPQD